MEQELGYYFIFRREATDIYQFVRHRNGSPFFIQNPDINNPNLTTKMIGEFCDRYQMELRRRFPNADVQAVLTNAIPNVPSTTRDDFLSQALRHVVKQTGLEVKCSSILPESPDMLVYYH